ncbi:hypothetical protein CMUST_09940 [Corynebacterium mustelae]|uniref:Uncharacterized protein n=1 Tax=Corynebacterium mustelae TaxID=571915 RepID=A0A0G3GYR3_9CORY|nr:hypothetical protein [Corynebacterium mustelae]AKK06304.1 hypothetical protein CMUST_09940 [Corynebacterium mustelae]
MSTFSEQYLALTDEERENLLPTIRPDAGLTEDDLAVVIADLQRSDEEFLHVEILRFLSQFPNSPQAKTALLSVLKQENPDDMVLSHAGQELMFFTLDDDDFDAIYRCLVTIHGDEDYENASAYSPANTPPRRSASFSTPGCTWTLSTPGSHHDYILRTIPSPHG